jgi:Glycosyl transferase family 2
MPGPGRRLANWLAGPYMREVTERVAEVKGDTERIERRLDELHAQLQGVLETVHHDLLAHVEGSAERLDAALVASTTERREQLGKVRRMLRHMDDETVHNRRRLYALRESEEYELAYAEPDPLVSFVLPTYKRWEKLCDVALPSILGQTHANVEVIVVGDQAPPETGEAIAALGDPRVRYYNRTVRGPYPDDPAVRWYMVGSPPFNDALSLVRGRWIAAMADDDAVRPDFAKVLLAGAREGRYENCYGRHRVVYPGGDELLLGSFPPKYAEFVTQAAIYHAGLRFFQMNLADPIYEEPNDWSLCRRMMDAGVRYGMIDAVVCDKHESRYDRHADWETRGIPKVD